MRPYEARRALWPARALSRGRSEDLASQLRANDLYGTLDAKSDEELLDGLIKPKKGDGSSCSPLDSATLEKSGRFTGR